MEVPVNSRGWQELLWIFEIPSTISNPCNTFLFYEFSSLWVSKCGCETLESSQSNRGKTRIKYYGKKLLTGTVFFHLVGRNQLQCLVLIYGHERNQFIGQTLQAVSSFWHWTLTNVSKEQESSISNFSQTVLGTNNQGSLHTRRFPVGQTQNCFVPSYINQAQKIPCTTHDKFWVIFFMQGLFNSFQSSRVQSSHYLHP